MNTILAVMSWQHPLLLSVASSPVRVWVEGWVRVWVWVCSRTHTHTHTHTYCHQQRRHSTLLPEHTHTHILSPAAAALNLSI